MLILAYDIGTTGVKTCLFDVEEQIRMIGSASCGYGLYILPDGGAEQHADEWWDGMCTSTKQLIRESGVDPSQIEGISFCSQMQGLVLVDRSGVPVRHPMSYMDQRASREIDEGIHKGLKIAGMNAGKLLKSLRTTGAVSGSVKDPMWKYLWVKNHEPGLFAQVHKWLDVKEYLICRCTGKMVMTEDSAFSTLLLETKNDRRRWSEELCDMFGVEMRHLPEIIQSTDQVGLLRAEQADQLGLAAGTPVYGGGGDASLIGIGTGSVRTGETHIYCGTSGWVSTVTEKQMVDTSNMIAATIGAQPGKYSYFAEMETAGKCLEWVRDHLALDEIGIYMEKKDITGDSETVRTSLYDYMSEVIDSCAPGAGGVVFTPWLHGNRCPFEDANAAGMFFNISLDTGKTEMIRAVVEGVCYHLRWMLECQEKKVKTSQTIRFCGGGALSAVTAQILSDILDRPVEVPVQPQNVGSVGAALTAAAGAGVIADLEEASRLIRPESVYYPGSCGPEGKAAYEKNYQVFRKLYSSNKKLFAQLNR